jgi:azurin
MRPSTIAFAAALLFSATGCGKDENKAAASTLAPAPTAAPAPPASDPPLAPSAAPKPAQKVDIQMESVANTMTFSKTTLSVPTGAEVHLTLKNNSTMATLPHNWVLVKPGTEASVAAAGLKMGEPAGYIDVRDHDMVVHTPLAKPGETTDVTFTAPDPGAYPYICTVPGHYMMMKGVLTVTP